MTKTPSSPAFTVVELVVCIVVIAIVAALAFFLVQHSTRKGGEAQCASNLRQIYLATSAYANEHNGAVPAPLAPVSGSLSQKSFAEELAAYLAMPTGSKGKSVWLCPEDKRDFTGVFLPCSYGMNGTVTVTQTDAEGLFSPLKLPRLSKIIFIADSGGNALPMPMVYYNISDAIKYKGIAFRHRGAMHDSAQDYASQQEIVKEAGTANFLFFDGHIEPLSYLDITDLMWVPLPQ